MIVITAPSQSHLLPLIQRLCNQGWSVIQGPQEGRLARNGQKVILRAEATTLNLRIFLYKVTGSGRSKPYERRIEITSTYQKGLVESPGFRDVVLGYDDTSGMYVGVDPQRIHHGGPTGNASSFFDVEGLNWTRKDEIGIRPRKARLFSGGLEFHAFLKPERLAEYLFNAREIHAGTYSGSGLFARTAFTHHAVTVRVPDGALSGDTLILGAPKKLRTMRPKVAPRLVRDYESGRHLPLRKAKLSPDQFAEIKRQMEENGRSGEEFVLDRERRELTKRGRADLAAKVRWVAQQSVCEGYDILSYEVTGDEKWIEVKATAGNSNVFELSSNEWQTACAVGAKYYIYRVVDVRTAPKLKHVLRDPKTLSDSGKITKTESGWRVRIAD